MHMGPDFVLNIAVASRRTLPQILNLKPQTLETLDPNSKAYTPKPQTGPGTQTLVWELEF